MSLECPSCGSRLLRPSRARDIGEALGILRLQSPMRCLDCKTRFIAPTVAWRDAIYAKCPKCARMDLNQWTGKTYTDPPFLVAFKVSLGAKKWRCEYCRLNFASFRKRKEVFTFRRWKKYQPQQEADGVGEGVSFAETADAVQTEATSLPEQTSPQPAAEVPAPASFSSAAPLTVHSLAALVSQPPPPPAAERPSPPAAPVVEPAAPARVPEKPRGTPPPPAQPIVKSSGGIDAVRPASPRIGFIGFGEAGFHIARGLRDEGVQEISAYDINTRTPGLGEKIRARAREAGVLLVNSNEQLTECSDILISTVTANQALAAAQQTAPGLTAGHLYADLNSVSPALKQSIDQVISATGARFAEVAVMAPAPPYGHKVPMLVGGNGGWSFIDKMSPFGMRMEFTSEKVGEAAATKMCRSVIVKGMEALLTECVLGASRYGAEERVFRSLEETFPGMDWSAMATYMVGRVVVHGERRAREMEEVAETLRSSGVDPIMAEAIVRRMDWSSQLGLKQLFGGEAPASHRQFADAVAELDKTVAG